MKTICYHHIDMGGYGAGYQVHLNEPSMKPEGFFKSNYNNSFKEKGYTGNIVYIVDLSFTKNNIQQLFEICSKVKKVIWIGHHVSSIEAILEYREIFITTDNLYYLVSEGTSGAALIYIYFYIINNWGDSYFGSSVVNYVKTKFNNCNISSSKFPPSFVQLPYYLVFISDYDCWNKINEDTDDFFLDVILMICIL